MSKPTKKNKAQLSEQARVEQALPLELADTVKKTKTEEKKQTVRNMRLKGFSVEQIADIADITIAEVYAFFKEIDAAQ